MTLLRSSPLVRADLVLPRWLVHRWADRSTRIEVGGSIRAESFTPPRRPGRPSPSSPDGPPAGDCRAATLVRLRHAAAGPPALGVRGPVRRREPQPGRSTGAALRRRMRLAGRRVRRRAVARAGHADRPRPGPHRRGNERPRRGRGDRDEPHGPHRGHDDGRRGGVGLPLGRLDRRHDSASTPGPPPTSADPVLSGRCRPIGADRPDRPEAHGQHRRQPAPSARGRARRTARLGTAGSSSSRTVPTMATRRHGGEPRRSTAAVDGRVAPATAGPAPRGATVGSITIPKPEEQRQPSARRRCPSSGRGPRRRRSRGPAIAATPTMDSEPDHVNSGSVAISRIQTRAAIAPRRAAQGPRAAHGSSLPRGLRPRTPSPYGSLALARPG